jgi:hypothetical protein
LNFVEKLFITHEKYTKIAWKFELTNIGWKNIVHIKIYSEEYEVSSSTKRMPAGWILWKILEKWKNLELNHREI